MTKPTMIIAQYGEGNHLQKVVKAVESWGICVKVVRQSALLYDCKKYKGTIVKRIHAYNRRLGRYVLFCTFCNWRKENGNR